MFLTKETIEGLKNLPNIYKNIFGNMDKQKINDIGVRMYPEGTPHYLTNRKAFEEGALWAYNNMYVKTERDTFNFKLMDYIALEKPDVINPTDLIKELFPYEVLAFVGYITTQPKDKFISRDGNVCLWFSHSNENFNIPFKPAVFDNDLYVYVCETVRDAEEHTGYILLPTITPNKYFLLYYEA